MIVAVSNYADRTNLSNLEFCEKDGIAMRNALTSPPLNFEILRNDVLIGNVKATTMRKAVSDFFTDRTVTENDIVLFYYTGHGILKDGKCYLASSDIDRDNPFASSNFTSNDVISLMKNCNSDKVIVVLDCCFAALTEVVKGTDQANAGAMIMNNEVRANLEAREYCVLCSCGPTDSSYPTRDGEHSLFTKYLVEGLQGSAITPEGHVTPESLAKYTFNKVRMINPDQKPVRKSEGSGSIILATYPIPNIQRSSTINTHITTEDSKIIGIIEAMDCHIMMGRTSQEASYPQSFILITRDMIRVVHINSKNEFERFLSRLGIDAPVISKILTLKKSGYFVNELLALIENISSDQIEGANVYTIKNYNIEKIEMEKEFRKWRGNNLKIYTQEEEYPFYLNYNYDKKSKDRYMEIQTMIKKIFSEKLILK